MLCFFVKYDSKLKIFENDTKLWIIWHFIDEQINWLMENLMSRFTENYNNPDRNI